jgi:hypothetical protein
MLAHFHAFFRVTKKRDWKHVVTNSQAVIDAIQTVYSPTTGLLPDFIIKGATAPQPAFPHFLEGPYDGQFYYNAGRVPWRIGLDVLLNDDPVSRTQVQKMSRWLQTATKGNPTHIKAGYTLDGLPIGDHTTSFFIAPFGVAAMSDVTQQSWLNAIYDAVYNRHEDYYEDSVTLLSLLAMSGNYWDPTREKP